MERLISYQETLNIVEAFMIRSGIRDFCSRVCGGKCCEKCYTSKNACHKNEGRRLGCSTYICGSLRIKLKDGFPRSFQHYYDVREDMSRKLSLSFSSDQPQDHCWNINTPEMRVRFKYNEKSLMSIIPSKSTQYKIKKYLSPLKLSSLKKGWWF